MKKLRQIKKSIECPTCKQDLTKPPKKTSPYGDCKQCGQSLTKKGYLHGKSICHMETYDLARKLYEKLENQHPGNVLRCHADERCPNYALMGQLRLFLTGSRPMVERWSK